MEGMDYDAISEMEPDEREWFVQRLNSQLKRENEEIKKAGAKNKGRGRSGARKR